MANANVDAEKVVFAADIVSFFMQEHYPHVEFHLKTDIIEVVNIYRPHVRKHFTENLKKILREIDKTQSYIVKRDFLQMQQNKIASSLVEYKNSFKSFNPAKTFSAGKFLLVCARVSRLSCFFFISGRKDDLNIVIDLIKDSFPSDEDECRLLWNEIDNVAENYESDSEGNSTPIFGRLPSESADVTSSRTKDSRKKYSQANASTLFGRDARKSADVIFSGKGDSSNMQGNAMPTIFNKCREIADGISSGTEDSCSSSSTTNTESDSSANTQDMSPASSDESLTKLVLDLKNMECDNTTKCEDNTKNKENAPIAAASSTGYVKYGESNTSIPTFASASSKQPVKCVESNQSGTAAENLGGSIQNSSVSSSTSDKCPKIDIDFKARFENAFMEVEGESSSSQKSPVKSPLKSCLGKRPSPRKGNVSFSDDNEEDSTESEIKKPKLRSPESKD